MLDAYAADSQSRNEMFAFGGYDEGERDKEENEWKAKKVTPVLYKSVEDHRYLGDTLRKWASAYSGCANGKRAIVTKHANSQTVPLDLEHYAVSLVKWPLTDTAAAQTFANMNPVPPLDWLAVLDRKQSGHDELPLSRLVDGEDGQWDAGSPLWAEWLTRHLGDPQLILWIEKHGGKLHPKFASEIEEKIKTLCCLKQQDNQVELDEIRQNAPRALPWESMLTLWHLILEGCLVPPRKTGDLRAWLQKLSESELSHCMKLELEKILAPRVVLRPKPAYETYTDETFQVQNCAQSCDVFLCEIALSDSGVYSTLQDLLCRPALFAALSCLLPVLTGLLHDALDLLGALGKENERENGTWCVRPSIDQYFQNSLVPHDWTVLIDLCRDAWRETLRKNHSLAQETAEAWWQIPYPLFKRLALNAAMHSQEMPSSLPLEWLLEDGGRWLWSPETERVTLGLLKVLPRRLQGKDQKKLEEALLLGPPPEMTSGSQNGETFTDHGTWVRLKMLEEGCVMLAMSLGPEAKQRLSELAECNPDFQQTLSFQYPIVFWTESGSPASNQVSIPQGRQELMEWLQSDAGRNPPFLQSDNWRERCREDLRATSKALLELADRGDWIEYRWREALSAWSGGDLPAESWKILGSFLASVPVERLEALLPDLSHWLIAVAPIVNENDSGFFAVIDRILEVGENTECLPSESYPHPGSQILIETIGGCTEALLKLWHRNREDQGPIDLPFEIRRRLEKVIDTNSGNFRWGRALLTAELDAFFFADREWTETHLLPLFDWGISIVEAANAWQGFLQRNPCLKVELISFLQEHFWETADHLTCLNLCTVRKYSRIFTNMGLYQRDTFNETQKLVKATRCLGEIGLVEALYFLLLKQEESEDQARTHWHSHIKPYFENIWPEDREFHTPKVAEAFGKLLLASGDIFPEELASWRHRLSGVEDPTDLFLILSKSQFDLPNRCPAAALEFLDIVVNPEIFRNGINQNLSLTALQSDLGKCLTAIENAERELSSDSRYVDLKALCGGK